VHILIYFLLLFSISSVSAQSLDASCIKNWKKIVTPVAKVSLDPDNPFSAELKSEDQGQFYQYSGQAPNSCHGTFGSNANLELISLNDKILVIKFTRISKEPVWLNFFDTVKIGQVGLNFKNKGEGYSSIQTNVLDNLIFLYRIVITKNENIKEVFSYKSPLISKYE
jgi:hypothetical protein